MKLSKIFESTHKLSYFGQCDKVRAISNDYEEYWQNMMKNMKKIPIKVFIDSVDLTNILDDDETPEGWINNSLQSDPTSGAYKSYWGIENVMFFKTAGFEFIFK